MTSPRSMRIEGLRKLKPSEGEDENALHAMEASVLGSAPLSELWSLVRAGGYEAPFSITHDGRTLMSSSEKNIAHLHDTVTVVSGPTTHAHEIGRNETFISHSNRQHGKPIRFDIAQAHGDPKRPTQTLKDGRGFNVSFQRTPRMPDDNKLHQLPGTLGSFDLFNVEAYKERLPQSIRDVGGIFLPMWQREAMWINFQMGTNQWATKYAVRVFVGRVNAVSGLLMDEAPRATESGGQLQDYVVIPGQRWLDGICVAPGVVRQFVAMPLGSGYTVEGQKTSEEKYGGLQIEVIPELQPRLRWWSLDSDEHLSYDVRGSMTVDRSQALDEMKSPADVGLELGDVVRSYPLSVVHRVPCTVQDLLGDSSSPVCKVLYRQYALSTPRFKGSRTSPPPSAARYEAQGLNLPNAPQAQFHARSTRPAPPRARDSKDVNKSLALGLENPISPHIPTSSSGRPPFNHEPEGISADTSKSVVKYSESANPPPARGRRADNPDLLGDQPVQSPARLQDRIDLDAYLGPPRLPLQSGAQVKQKSRSTPNKEASPQASPTQAFDSIDPNPAPDGDNDPTALEPRTRPTENRSQPGPQSEKAIDQNDVLDSFADLQALGLAAGGKLIQDIYTDPYAASTWNHAAARIVHVHILDPASCERVTHIVPLPMPVSVKAYADAGGQFYVVEEKIGERVGGGAFGGVKSVSEMDRHVGVSTLVEEEFDPRRPKMCRTCEVRLCDCVVRPCNHQFCNECVRQLDSPGRPSPQNRKCPTCGKPVSHVAGFSAPMNLPGEEPMRMKVAVNVLEIKDGRTRFKSVQKTRI